MSEPDRNAVWASLLVEELARGGLRTACLSPGSRSTPIVLALARHPAVRTLVHPDERSAAFLALGIGKASGRPAAVVTTSGTAVANLLPAVVEADQSEAPLLLLTADRPGRLRGQDANQTIDQLQLFGARVRLFHEVGEPRLEPAWLRYLRALPARALAAALGPPAGPVHLNLAFEKPLEPAEPTTGEDGAGEERPRASGGRPGARRPEGGDAAVAGTAEPHTRTWSGRAVPDEEALDALAAELAVARRPLLLCGPSAEPGRLGPAALRLAAAVGCPLLADPLSGARFAAGAGAHALGGYDLLLRDPEARAALKPEVVIRAGLPPPSTAVDAALEAWSGARQVVVDAGVRWKDHAARGGRYVRADAAATLGLLAERLERGGREEVDGSARGAWLRRWWAAENAVRSAVERELEGEFFEGAAVAEVAARLPAGATLFIGNSMPVRDLESFAAPRDVPLAALGNRGASGIDGSVSTAFGAALASEGPTAAVIGDLALYHDMNGLIAARRFGIDLCLVVLHNDGGGIFHLLPIRRHEPPFTSHFVAPHGLDFRHAARLYDLGWERAEGRGALRDALDRALGEGGTRLIEVPSDPDRNRIRHEEVAEAARRAAAAALRSRA